MKSSIEKASVSFLKEIRELLRSRKYRDDRAEFIAEGDKIVRDIISTKNNISSVLCSASYINNSPEIIRHILSRNIPLVSAKDAFFEKLSILRRSQGILAVVKKPTHNKSSLKNFKKGLLLLCDNIQDPGNMGTLIRTAAAFSVSAVLLYGKNVDIFNPKVVRASVGSVPGLPVFDADINALKELKQKGFNILCADNSRDKSISIFDLQADFSKSIIVFGNEGNGISPEIKGITDNSFFIPISENIESLNVASACGVSLFYFTGRKI